MEVVVQNLKDALSWCGGVLRALPLFTAVFLCMWLVLGTVIFVLLSLAFDNGTFVNLQAAAALSCGTSIVWAGALMNGGGERVKTKTNVGKAHDKEITGE